MPWRVLIVTCIVAAIAGLGNARAWGQMIVHAMTGTIRSVSATQLTATSSGHTQTFSLEEKSHPFSTSIKTCVKTAPLPQTFISLTLLR